MKIKLFSTATIHNDVGGTTRLPEGRYRVEVDREWDDYETGGHISGLLVDDEAIEIARTEGTTGRTPEDYKDYPYRADKVAEHQKTWNPTRVFCSEFEEIKKKCPTCGSMVPEES